MRSAPYLKFGGRTVPYAPFAALLRRRTLCCLIHGTTTNPGEHGEDDIADNAIASHYCCP